MTHHPLRAAMVGLRIHAGGLEPDHNHGLIKSFHAQDDVEVVAYCEWEPAESEALATLKQLDPAARIYTNLDDLLAEEAFDLAVVMLPPNEAISTALRLAAAGKHLFIEKQAARTAAELLPLCRLATERNLVMQAGYPWPRHPIVAEIRRCLDEGVLGRLLAIEARLVTIQVAPGLRDPQHWMYRRASEGGGILHMEGGHWLTLFQHFTQAEVHSVTALCSRTTDSIEEGLEDVATVALEYTNRVHACLHMGYLLSAAGPRNDTYIGVRGELGAATWSPAGAGNLTVSSTAQNAPERTIKMQLAPRPVYADQWGYEFVADFVRAVRHNDSTGGQNTAKAVVSIEDAYQILQIIDAAYESSQTGRRVVL